MSKNSFKELEIKNRDRFSEKEDFLKVKINGSMNLLRFVGSMFEMFIPSFMRVVSGVNDKRKLTSGAPTPTNPAHESSASFYPNQSSEE